MGRKTLGGGGPRKILGAYNLIFKWHRCDQEDRKVASWGRFDITKKEDGSNLGK